MCDINLMRLNVIRKRDFSLLAASFPPASLFEKLSGSNIDCRRLLRNGSADTAEQMLQ